MQHAKERSIFQQYLNEKKLKLTEQRRSILNSFLAAESHFSVEELYNRVKVQTPEVGYTTVYRTLKLLTDCGLANELKFADGISRYEHLFGHEHHDHLVCRRCGKLIEVVDEEIEALQQKLALKHQFNITAHRMELYGYCQECQR